MIKGGVNGILVLSNGFITTKTEPGKEIQIRRVRVFDLKFLNELMNIMCGDFFFKRQVITIQYFLDTSVDNFVLLFFELIKILFEVLRNLDFLNVVVCGNRF